MIGSFRLFPLVPAVVVAAMMPHPSQAQTVPGADEPQKPDGAATEPAKKTVAQLPLVVEARSRITGRREVTGIEKLQVSGNLRIRVKAEEMDGAWDVKILNPSDRETGTVTLYYAQAIAHTELTDDAKPKLIATTLEWKLGEPQQISIPAGGKFEFTSETIKLYHFRISYNGYQSFERAGICDDSMDGIAIDLRDSDGASVFQYYGPGEATAQTAKAPGRTFDLITQTTGRRSFSLLQRHSKSTKDSRRAVETTPLRPTPIRPRPIRTERP